MTLLNKAKSTPIVRDKQMAYGEEELELVLSFLKGEITLSQMNGALSIPNNRNTKTYSIIARTIKEGITRGDITITKHAKDIHAGQ